MTQTDLIQRAQQGDAEAIAALMNVALETIGATAKATMQGQWLHILLEAYKPLNPEACIEFVSTGIEQLGIDDLAAFVLYGRLIGQEQPEWIRQVKLFNPEFEEDDDLTNVRAFTADKALDTSLNRPTDNLVDMQNRDQQAAKESYEGVLGGISENGVKDDFQQLEADNLALAGPTLEYESLAAYVASRSPQLSTPQETVRQTPVLSAPTLVGEPAAKPPRKRRKKKRLPRRLLLLVVPLAITVGIWQIWQRYFVADPTLDGASSNPAVNGTTLATGDVFQVAVNHATRAVDLGRTANTKDEWQAAATAWEQAIAGMEQVPKTHPKYAIAQQRVTQYQKELQTVRDAHLTRIKSVRTLMGDMMPKSITHDGQGRFYVANGGDTHTITVFNRDFQRTRTISDRVRLSQFGFSQFTGAPQGEPIDTAIAAQGGVWFSNQQVQKAGEKPIPINDCRPEQKQPNGFLYHLRRGSRVDGVVQVGTAPRAIATTPDGRYVLASNWCSWDVSIVNAQTRKEVRRVQVGPYPADIAIDPKSQTAYVAISGTTRIAAIKLETFEVRWLENVGRSPLYLALSPDAQFLFATLKGENKLAKIKLAQPTEITYVDTEKTPQGVTLTPDGAFAYVANSGANSISKVRTGDMQVIERVPVKPFPIDLAYDPTTQRLWVACASGHVVVLQDAK